jgi:NTE family protein
MDMKLFAGFVNPRVILFLIGAAMLGTLAPALPSAAGQEAGPQKRPKIGLALSGGGARGFAHIGVLKWFEEHRIPVDYIAGTSMGGLVGGLYATGKSPKSMQELVGGLDWDALLRGYPTFQQLSYRRKEDRLYLPGPIVIGLKRGISRPAGMNAGMEIGLVFDRVTLSYDNVGSFDNLPIPFRCVATDLVAAEPVILKQGSLSRALRATMSLPGMFTPVEIDNRILADGGVLNNVPTDVVKEMGADVVIAVDIGTPLGDKEALNSLFGVLNQTSGVATIENIRRNIRLADLLISPDLEEYTLLDFYSSAAIADLGYKGAEQKALLLQKLSLSEVEWREHLAARQARALPEAQVSPAFVKIEGTKSIAGEAITEGLTKLEGKPLDTELVERELKDAWGTGRFDALNYEWIVENGKTGLLIRAQEKTYGPPFLDLGLVVNNSSTDDTEANLLGRLTIYDIGRESAEWRTDFSLGSQLLLGTEYFRPLGGRFFAAPYGSYGKLQQNLFARGGKIAEYQQKTAKIGLDLGYSLSAKSEMRLGYSVSHFKGERTIGSPILPNVSGAESVATLRWNYFGQNSPQFPTRGLLLRSSANWFFKSPGAEEGFPQAETRAVYAYPLDERNILFVAGSGGTTFGKTAPPFQKFPLGGVFRVGGFGRGEFRGDHYLFGELGYLRLLHRLPPFLGGGVFAGGWLDTGKASDDFDTASYATSGTGGLLIETRLGPIFVGLSWAEGGRGKFYFALGRIF